MEGWLCPALFKYFPKAPRDIFVRPEPKSRESLTSVAEPALLQFPNFECCQQQALGAGESADSGWFPGRLCRRFCCDWSLARPSASLARSERTDRGIARWKMSAVHNFLGKQLLGHVPLNRVTQTSERGRAWP